MVNIRVKTITGDAVVIPDLPTSTKVAELKAQIQEKTSIPVAEQRLK